MFLIGFNVSGHTSSGDNHLQVNFLSPQTYSPVHYLSQVHAEVVSDCNCSVIMILYLLLLKERGNFHNISKSGDLISKYVVFFVG